MPSTLSASRIGTFALLALLLTSPVHAAAPTGAEGGPEKVNVDKLNKKIDFALKTPDGKVVSSASLADRKAIVVVFLSFDCPVSNSYAPTLAALHKEFAGKDVAFVGVCGDDLTHAQLTKQVSEYKLPFAVLKDEGFKTTDAFQAKTAPEAFLLDQNQVLRYRGRIDNAFAARLKRNAQTTSHDLKNALVEVLAGKSPATPATRPIGCPLQREEAAKKDGAVTYYRDVLPILQANCQQCHRPGEVGPFSLMTYRQARNWAQDIKEYTRDGKMPPWKPVAGRAFHNDRRLSDKDLATLATWADNGTPEGDARHAPKPRTFPEGWQLGKPDLVLTVNDEMTIGASGRDVFRCFVLPTGLAEDKHVVAVEVRPGNNRIVHHSLNFFDLSGKARDLEKKEQAKGHKDGAQDFGPGYSVAMGLGFTPESGKVGGIGGWAPGQVPRYLPEGYGYPLPKGSDFVIQLHYHRNGRVEKDRTSVGLYFAKKAGVKPFKSLVIPGRFLFIPAGVERHKVKGSIEVHDDCEVHSIMPHMHMLGKEVRVTMTPPNGKTETLLDIRDWDYNWQETYFLKESIRVAKGTKFGVEAIYDNSSKNPNNPFSPPQWVRFGDQTDNEMCFVFMGATNNERPGRIRFTPEGLAVEKKD